MLKGVKENKCKICKEMGHTPKYCLKNNTWKTSEFEP
jgi:hypothetical protein